MGITRLTISNHSEPTPRTNKAKPLTWGQLKKLTTEREKLVKEQRQPLTSATLFLAMLSVVITMVGANHTYWAYVPNPPLLRSTMWEDSSVPVFINDSSWLPRSFDPSLPLKPEEEGRQLSNVSVNYTVGTDLTPICMGAETHCLKRGLQSWLSIVKESQGNKIHFFLLEAFFFNITGENTTVSPCHLPNCVISIKSGLGHWVQWKLCNANTGHAALNMPANLENSAVATGLEKISFHSNPKERQCQRMFKLPHSCTHLTH